MSMPASCVSSRLVFRAEHEWRRHSALVLEPEVSKVGWDEFEKAGEMIAAGEAAAEAAMPQILSWFK